MGNRECNRGCNRRSSAKNLQSNLLYVLFWLQKNYHNFDILTWLSEQFIVSAGSWATLETLPKERGLDTRQELLKFYEENYSANLMHLVVYVKGDVSFCYV